MRAVLLAILMLPVVSSADVLTPGHKSVRHDLVLTWDDAVGDCSFVAFPTQGFGVAHPIERDVPFRFSSKYSTRIYAVPSGAPLPESREDWLAAAWPSAEVPVGEVRSIDANHPLTRMETKLRVTRVGADDIGFERVSHELFDEGGDELGGTHWLPLALIAVVGAILVLVLARRARRKATSTPA